jgi:hypothetical protein
MIATCLACNGHLDVFQLDAGNGSDAGTEDPDSGYGVAIVPADILFVVDNSGSMADEQENLAINFQSFVDQTAGWADYRIGVVTTDLSAPDGERGGYTTFTFSASYPHILTDFDYSACAPTGIDHGCFRGPDPALRAIDGQLTREEQIDAFADNIRVGTCGVGVEGGLEAMLEALRNTGPGGCNQGFLRAHANLVLIIVSDEDDSGARPIQDIVFELGQLKPFHQVRVATVVGSIGGEPASCGPGSGDACGSVCDAMPPPGSLVSCMRDSDCPSSEFCAENACNNGDLRYWSYCSSCSFYDAPDCCSALPASRYVEFARAVEQRVHDVRPEFPIADCQSLGTRAACLTESICQASFGDTLARIARELVLVDL